MVVARIGGNTAGPRSSLNLEFCRSSCWTQFFHQQQQRPFSFKHYRHAGGSNNPYVILGVPVNSSYQEVKAAFLKQAMEHHPDRSAAGDSSSSKKDTATFIRMRHAFEEIVEDHKKGGALHGAAGTNNNNVDDASWQGQATWSSDEEFREWFRHETSNHLTFDMCEKTRAEVIHVYKTMSAGGKDKGGYWEMARQLAERENVAGINMTGRSTRKLASGKSSTTMRRRRKR